MGPNDLKAGDCRSGYNDETGDAAGITILTAVLCKDGSYKIICQAQSEYVEEQLTKAGRGIYFKTFSEREWQEKGTHPFRSDQEDLDELSEIEKEIERIEKAFDNVEHGVHEDLAKALEDGGEIEKTS